MSTVPFKQRMSRYFMQFAHTAQLFETDRVLTKHFLDSVISFTETNLLIQYWNYGAKLTFGLTPEEAIGQSLSVLSISQFCQKIKFIISDLKINHEWRGEFSHLVNERESHFLFSVSVVRNHYLQNEYLLVIKDITERRELENRFTRLNYDLEEQIVSKEIEMNHFFERINEGFFSLDRNWCYRYINSKAAGLLNRVPADLIGKNVWIEFPELVNSVFYSIYHEAMNTQEFKRIKEYSAMLDTWFDVDIYPSAEGLSIFFKDISEKKLAERLIMENQEQYQKIVENAQEGIWMIDENHKTTLVNPCMAEMLGYTSTEMVGKDLFDFMPPQLKAVTLTRLEQRQKGISEQQEFILMTKNGEDIWISIQITPLYKNERYAGLLAMIMNITERKRNEEVLLNSNEQLRQLASRLQTVREEERASIARDIHDDLGQQLTVLKMDIYWLSRRVQRDPLITQRIDNMLVVINNTLTRVEKKAIELHPSLLHDLGLLAAIEWQNKEFESRYSIRIALEIKGSDQGIPNDIAITLYRIYQESLINVIKHAKASVIHVRLSRTPEGYELTLHDNGCGFDIDSVDKKQSLGLLSMKERCVVIGAQFKIESKPAEGTTVSVFVPTLKSKEK